MKRLLLLFSVSLLLLPSMASTGLAQPTNGNGNNGPSGDGPVQGEGYGVFSGVLGAAGYSIETKRFSAGVDANDSSKFWTKSESVITIAQLGVNISHKYGFEKEELEASQ
ncbi:MAG: hypothetical protein AB8B55_20350 [Mariniblastus sp.]